MDIEGAGHEVCIGHTTHCHEMILLFEWVAIFYENILYTLLLMIMWLYNAHLEIFMRLCDALLETIGWLCVQNMCIA